MLSNFPKHIQVAFRDARYKNSYKLSDGKPVYQKPYELLLFLSKCLNFTYKVVIQKDKSVTMSRKGGNWSGIMGMIQRGEADVSFEVQELYPTTDVDYTYPLFYDRVTFLTQNPRPIEKDIILFQPFSGEVWMIFAIFTLGFFLLFWLLSTSAGQRCTRIFFLTLGNTLGQPFSLPLTTRSLVLLFVGWISGISILIHSFKAIILSFLVAIPTTGISTIDELASAVTQGSAICGQIDKIDRFRNSSDTSYRIIGKSISENSEFRYLYKFVDPDSARRTALISVESNLVILKRNMFLSKDSFFYVMFGIKMKKKFRGKRVLDKTTKRMFETGLTEKMRNDFAFKITLLNEKRFRKSTNTADDDVKKITLEDLKGAFLIYCAGVTLALLCFFGEILFFKASKKLKLRKKRVFKIPRN